MIRRFDGRWLLLGFLAAYLGTVALGALDGSWDAQWRAFGGAPMSDKTGRPVAFGDTVFLLSVLACDRAGYDVYRQNPCDLVERRMNYPRLWLLMRWLPLELEHHVWMGATIGFLFIASTLAYVGRLNVWEGMLYAVVMCSPSIMLGVERGNSDLLIYALVAAAVILISRRAHAYWGYLLLLLAALLKFFPIAALLTALRESRTRAAIICAGLGTVWIAYLWWTWADLALINRAMSRSLYRSYGGRVLLGILTEDLRGGFAPLGTRMRVIYATAIAILIIAAVAAAFASARPPGSTRLDGLRAGAGIYIATYLPVTNFDYKQAFLILMMPQLLEWSRTSTSAGRLSALVLGGWAVTLWMSSWHHVFVVGEVINMLLFVYCVYVLVSTRPSWLGPGQSVAGTG
jgi:hypothetical protein